MRTIGVKLMADVAGYTRGLQTASRSTKDFLGEIDRASKGGHLDAVTQQATGLGLGLLGVAGAAVKMSADFDKQMSAVRAATHASTGDMDKLRQAALAAGADTKFSATEAAQGIEELSKAGVSTAAILGGGLAGALDLAAAGGLEVGEAAETAASALTQFKLQGKDVPHVADLLAAAAGKAQGSVHDMGMALNQSGLVASQMGLSVEEATGTLAAFANAGLTGSDAGTSFKQSMLMLAAPTEKAAGLMQDLGINAYDAQGKFVGMTKLAGQLKTRLGGLTQEQRNAALATIFGADAIRAASVLYDQGATGIQSWIDKTNDAGYAAETAQLKTDNLAGDVERLTGSLQTMAIEAGSGANSGLRVLVKATGSLVDEFGQLNPAVGSTITVLAGLSGALLLGGVAWVKVRTSIAATVAELNAVGPAGARAATALQAVTKGAGIAGVAFVGLEVAGAVFDKLGNSAVNVDKLTASLQNYATTGKMSAGLTDEFGKNLDELALVAQAADSASHGLWGTFNDALSSIPGVSSAIDSMNESLTGTSFNDATERMKALDQSFAAFIGTQKDARKAGELWNQVLLKSGLDTEQLAKLLPGAWQGLQNLQQTSHGAAGGQAALGGATAKTAEQIKEEKERVKELEDSFNSLFGAQMSVDRAQIKYRQGVEALSTELRTGSRDTRLNTVEGRKNRTAVLDQIETIDDLRAARMKHGATLEEAGKKYVKDIDGLRKSMRQAGFTKKQIDELTSSYRKIPSQVDTKLSVTGAPAVKGQLKDLLIYQNALKRGVTVKQAATFYQGLAYGGRVAGSSPHPRADNIPAMLTADEWVHPVDSVSYYGPQVMRAIQNKQIPVEDLQSMLPGYAGGGRVVWPFPTTAKRTRVPSRREAMNAVTPAAPSGGRTDDFIVRVVKQAFPGLDWISKYRPGSRTLSGNVSYHSRHRAVDWPASHDLAVWWNQNYKAQTKEFISPWNDLNIHNGRRHAYTGAIYRQHNFAGGNAHDHIAMAAGGVINEPVYGIGASGTSYSFGERGSETVTPGVFSSVPGGGGSAVATTVVNVTFSGPVGSQYELQTWLVGTLDDLKRRGRV